MTPARPWHRTETQQEAEVSKPLEGNMTDLQAHVEAPGRADLVKQVAEKIKQTGVDYIYYQFISVTGRIVG
jgi:glutamine synthetase